MNSPVKFVILASGFPTLTIAYPPCYAGSGVYSRPWILYGMGDEGERPIYRISSWLKGGTAFPNAFLSYSI